MSSLIFASALGFTVPNKIVQPQIPRPAIAMVEAQVEAAQIEPGSSFCGAAFADVSSDDPNMTCFLRPDWMEGESEWVCVPTAQITPNMKSAAEDSY